MAAVEAEALTAEAVEAEALTAEAVEAEALTVVVATVAAEAGQNTKPFLG